MTPNRILPIRPEPAPHSIVLADPRWYRLTFRVLMLLIGPILLYFSLSSRSPLPPAALIIVSITGISTFCFAVWHRPWSLFERFIADDKGIAFPANLLITIGKTIDERWLFIPWANIHNVRTAVQRGDPTSCVAFDLEVTPIERRDFFANVGEPTDRSKLSQDMVHAAYDVKPPAPKRTVAALLALRGSGPNKSLERTREG